MSHSRLMTWQKATALVPLALLSAGWTASLAVPTSATAASEEARLPDGTVLPSDAIKAPASVSVPGVIAPGVPEGTARSVVASASTNGIPDAALTAYRRAAQVIDTADPSCNADWTLIAAIGRVESDHGRYGNNTLTDEGLSRPGIYGIPLDGSNGTAEISDTDAGELDDDDVFDRAVGPMQFIPSTWSVVGVDGDGDGVRNPQDIDDAALATAVYLCSGDEDLATDQGARAAVYRYNHSQQYVDLVLSIAEAYADGDFSSIPNGSTATATFTPDPANRPGTSGPAGRPGRSDGNGDGGGDDTGSGGGGGSKGDGDGGGTASPTTSPAPTGGGTGGGTGGSAGGGGNGGGSSDPTPDVPAPTAVTQPVQPVLISAQQAVDLCTAQLQSQFGAAPQQAVQQCADALAGKTLAEAQNAVPGIVSGLAGLVTSLLPAPTALPDLPGGLG